MNELIKIDPKEIQILAGTAGDLVFKPSAEKALDELIKTRDLLIETVDSVLAGIREAGEQIHPDFRGIKGELFNISKRQFGNRYTFKQADLGKIEPFLKPVSYSTVNAEAVDNYIETVGELPDGIFEKDREFKMVIKRKDEPDED